MRRAGVVGALTSVAFASAAVFACGDDATPAREVRSTPVRAPTSAPALDPNIEEPVEENWSAALDSDPRITEEVVEGILPSPSATSASLGLPPAAWFLRPDLGQEFEGFDFQGSGMTAGWVAWFQPVLTPAAGDPLEGMYLSLAFHRTGEDAELTYRYIVGATGAQAVDEQEIADAVSLMPGYPPDAPTVTHIVIRQRTVTASVVLLHTENRDVVAGLQEFARMLALGIDEFVRSQGP